MVYLVIVISLKLFEVALLQVVVWYPVKKSIFLKFWKFFKIEIFWKCIIFTWNQFLRFSSYVDDQAVKKHLNFHVNPNFISKKVRAHTDANFKKFGWTLGGRAVSARRGARTVVKCIVLDSLIKIYDFWLLGHRHSSKTRFCGSKMLHFFFRR